MFLIMFTEPELGAGSAGEDGIEAADGVGAGACAPVEPGAGDGATCGVTVCVAPWSCTSAASEAAGTAAVASSPAAMRAPATDQRRFPQWVRPAVFT